MHNLEVKARCNDLQRALAQAQAFGAQWQGCQRQRDTYFCVSSGKLKLREVEGQDAELIAYHRPSLQQARLSEYVLYHCADPLGLKTVLQAVLGIDIVVEKVRTLLLWQNVRIHLDDVKKLGTFIELEAVIREDADLAISSERIALLQQTLHIAPQHVVGKGYYELLKEKMTI